MAKNVNNKSKKFHTKNYNKKCMQKIIADLHILHIYINY